MNDSASNKIVAEIRMRRSSHPGSFLIVEGKDDELFWKLRCHDSCRLIVGGGKNNVLSGVQRLDDIQFKGALGVVDSDYDCLTIRSSTSKNLVTTDAHDLECMLCRSPALNSVLVEFGDSEKINRFEKQYGKDVRAALLERGLIFGNLRRAGTIINRGLISRFVNENGWTVDEDELIHEAVGSSDAVDANTLRHWIARLPPMDPWHVVHGHDLLHLLRIGLRSTLGDLSANTGISAIARVLRPAMQLTDLQSTGLWQDMRLWENRNTPFLVLAEER